MTDEQAREDIAFIRRALEEGRVYAVGCSSDLLIWGVAVAIGHFATYAFVRGWATVPPNWLWTAAIGLPWIYSLRRLWSGGAGNAAPRASSPMVMALRMLWLGCGIFLTTLAIAATWTDEMRFGWFNAVAAGVLGIGVFTTAWLAGLPWLRWVGVAWWLGELLLYGLRQRPEAILVAGVLTLVLLAGPGIALVARRTRRFA